MGNGLIAAHLLGNMWQQDWSNLWDQLEPYWRRQPGHHRGTGKAVPDQPERGAGQAGKDANIAAQYKAQREAELRTARQMTERAQDFYVSLGMPSLPQSYWERTQFIKPDDRDVVCHASAWDMNMEGDVRTKMCIKPNEENFTTIYHELGHIYYDLAYNPLPPLFQGGANDGFHEAIGDTIVLAMTPKYLSSIGLVDAPTESREAVINNQMRMALSGVSFLPFGLMIDRWRWGVFDGSITADNYNKAWWDLKARVPGRGPGQHPWRRILRPGREVPRAGQHPTPATSWRASCSSSSTRACAMRPATGPAA